MRQSTQQIEMSKICTMNEDISISSASQLNPLMRFHTEYSSWIIIVNDSLRFWVQTWMLLSLIPRINKYPSVQSFSIQSWLWIVREFYIWIYLLRFHRHRSGAIDHSIQFYAVDMAIDKVFHYSFLCCFLLSSCMILSLYQFCWRFVHCF